MTEVLWDAVPPSDPEHTPPHASPAVRKVLAAVRAGTAGRLFPPVLRPADDGVLAHGRFPAGDTDAATLAAALATPRFAPLTTLLDTLDAWCRETVARRDGLLAPGLPDVADGALFGPLVTEAFTACAAGTPYDAEAQCARLTAFLDRFLRRLARDAAGPWFDRPSLSLPVTGLEAQDGETHNGRRRVLRVRMSGGGSIAYKPRPAGGEPLFLPPDDSVFALLNTLPPASGAIRLPVLRCTPGSGPDGREYTWQEWLEPPAQWGVVRRSAELRLYGTRLGHRQARLFWHRAGSLAATAFRFGIADLGEGNVLAGCRPGEPELLLHPVDLEVFLTPLRRLYDTGLVADTAAGDHHHPGLEDQARWCTVDGPVAHFTERPRGGLRLVRRRRPCARAETRTVVADTDGRTGYGPYLPSFLRGMFDAWTLMSRHHETIRAFLDGAARDRYVRVLLKPTAAYTEFLADRLTGTGPAPESGTATVFGPAETAQLDGLDVPYFFRLALGGALLSAGPPPSPVPAEPHPEWPPSASVRDDRGRDLAGLGVALRDAAEYAYDTVGPRTLHGDGVLVRLTDRHTGEARFDWPEAGRRITYSWDRDAVRVRAEPLARPRLAPDVRRRLLRIDRVDAELRARWVASGFADEAVEERLRALTDAAMNWLRDVVDRHGWPGRALVGPAAADAACRLVQHTEEPLALQRECLRLVEAAARDGDLPWRQVAYVTDALRVRESRPQVYGTKFRMREGRLEPCPMEQPDQVDARRRDLGMEPLARYAARLRRRYQPQTP